MDLGGNRDRSRRAASEVFFFSSDWGVGGVDWWGGETKPARPHKPMGRVLIVHDLALQWVTGACRFTGFSRTPAVLSLLGGADRSFQQRHQAAPNTTHIY